MSIKSDSTVRVFRCQMRIVYPAIVFLLLNCAEVIGAAVSYSVGASPIHGKGVFLDEAVVAEQVIGIGITDALRVTEDFGVFINHCQPPVASAKLVMKSNGVWVHAIRDLPAGTEVTVDYAAKETRLLIQQPASFFVDCPLPSYSEVDLVIV